MNPPMEEYIMAWLGLALILALFALIWASRKQK